MKNSKSDARIKSVVSFSILLLAVLILLFWRSFQPGYVHFNNDGPIGQQNTDWQRLPGGFTGMWVDLNDIGYSIGSQSPSVTALIRWALGPVGVAKFYAPLGLFILSLGAWSFLRALKLTPLAAALGALAFGLCGCFCGGACWGVASLEIAMGMNCFALALALANIGEKRRHVRIIRLALAGLCVGMNVVEAADIGALCSIFVALIVFFSSLFEEGQTVGSALRGAGRVAVIGVFAAFIAFQSIVVVIGTSVSGITGTAQDEQTKQARWDFATQWSLSKKETLGYFIPGLFGYKMDTPADINPLFKDCYTNGVYWGASGREPAIDRYLDTGGDTPPQGLMRFGYAGYYSGILVWLVAIWALAQSFRKDSPFSAFQKKSIWLWGIAIVISLLLSWGRFAPAFYGVLYHLPYFSTIRNPSKFSIFFSWGVTVLFAFGVHLLNRRYLDAAGPKSAGLVTQVETWWARAGGFDRKWTWASVAAVIAAAVAWFIYNSKMPQLVQYLHIVGFPGDDPSRENSGAAIAAFSVHQVAWFVALLAVAAGLLILIITGYFSGSRAKLGMVLLGGFMLFDMGRADIPWVVHWNYVYKYEVGTLNPVVDFLRQKPYENRVAAIPFEPQQSFGNYDDYFGGNGIYRIEWAQHHFPYYNIQSLDLIQMPRMPERMKAYLEDFAPRPGAEAELPLIARHWELSNTRYLLGAAGYLNALNQELDPGRSRFRIAMRFDVTPKPGVERLSDLKDFTVVTNDTGQLALFDFTGVLPRASLFSSWVVNTNETNVLKTLADLNFDPHRTVLVSTPQKNLPPVATNVSSGTVEFKSYHPKDIVLDANATAPSVLLLNDRYDANWKVSVDGQPAPLLKCNYDMRGVYLQPGKHTVAFTFRLPSQLLYVTVGALIVAFLLGIALLVTTRRTQTT